MVNTTYTGLCRIESSYRSICIDEVELAELTIHTIVSCREFYKERVTLRVASGTKVTASLTTVDVTTSVTIADVNTSVTTGADLFSSRFIDSGVISEFFSNANINYDRYVE